MYEIFVQNAGLTVTVISLIVSIIISIIYKFTINQDEAKETKKKMKTLQAKIKELTKSGKQKEAMELQKKISELSLKQMRSTFKPMLVSMIVVIPIFIFIFPSLYAIDPIALNGESGEFIYQGETHQISYTLQDEGKVFESGSYKFEFGDYNSKRNELAIRRVIVESPVSIPFAGHEIGWLGWYILTSIPFSILIRKLLGIV